jgi:PPE-repeat protein
MPDPAWPSSPPEANYLRLVGSGAAGTATTLASAAAWQALVATNEVAASASTLNTAATALSFEGVGGLASATTATGLNTSLHLLAAWAQQKPPIAASAVAAYETALSSMIPAEVSLANRAEQAADVALNPLVLGALTPAIVALDLIYFGEHWPHNASAGAAYGAALTALLPALAVPPPLAPPGASSAAPVAAAAAVAETAGQTAAGEAMKQSGEIAKVAVNGTAAPTEVAGQVGQLASSMMQPLQSTIQPLTGMFQAPTQALQSLSGLSQSALGQVNGPAGTSASGDIGLPAAMLAAPGTPGVLGTAGGGSGLVGGPGVGSVGGAGVGGAPGSGLTSYTRPTSTFAPEHSGRPAGLNAGLLSTADYRGLTTTAGSGPVPVSPAHTGMLGQGKAGGVKEDVAHARIVVPESRRSD